MLVKRYITSYHTANYYLITTRQGKNIFIDFGEIDSVIIKEVLESIHFSLDFVFLTHEHIDHCAGLSKVAEHVGFELLCLDDCGRNIGNKKQNLSFYLESLDNAEIKLDYRKVDDNDLIHIDELAFRVISTPGHSPGSMCIMVDNCLFTGDTFLGNQKTPLSFPHSSKVDYKHSLEKLTSFIRPDTMIFPGHGKEFIFNT